MLSLSAKIRERKKQKLDQLREKGIIPAVLYGSKTDNTLLSIDLKEFSGVYEEAGENALIGLNIENQASDKKGNGLMVLIHEVQKDPVTGAPIHVDFFQPSLTEEIETEVPLVFIGESEAINELGGTLVKHLFEIEVKSLPQDIPGEIEVDISKLETFDNEIYVKELSVPANVEILREPDEIVATVSAPEKVEEELEKPIEEKVEEVEKVEEEKEEKEAVEEEKTEKAEEETEETEEKTKE